MTKYTIEQMEDFQWLVKRESEFEDTFMGAARTLTELPRILMGVEDNQEKYAGDIDFIAGNLMGLAKTPDGYSRPIETIKAIRAITGCGLKEAKEAYERMKEKHHG